MNSERVFDLEEALSRIEHDYETFRLMAELFLEIGPKDLGAVKAAVEARDPVATAQTAHRLKGSVMQFCAPVPYEAAKALEMMGKAGDMTGAADAYAGLESGLTRLVEALRRTLEEELAA